MNTDDMLDFELLAAFGEIELDHELAGAKQAFYDSLDSLSGLIDKYEE